MKKTKMETDKDAMEALCLYQLLLPLVLELDVDGQNDRSVICRAVKWIKD